MSKAGSARTVVEGATLEPIGHYLESELYELVRLDPRIFDFLAAGSLDGMWYWDLENPEHEWMSPRFWETLGYDPEEMPHLASAWQTLINESDLKAATKNFIEHCEDPTHPYDQVVRYRHKSGSTTWVRCRGIAIRDDEGKPVRMLGTHTDITELKEAEANLARKTRELEQSNTHLEQFAYIASHDLQEPLRMVTGFLSLLEESCGDELGADAKEYIGFAVDGAKRMRNLIDDLLGYSRVCSKSRGFGATDRGAALDDALMFLKEAIEESGAVITRDELPTVSADPVQVSQLLQNLIGNSIKYRSEEPPRVHVEAVQREQEWVFSVGDNGIGIDSDYFDRIFLMFQRLERSSGSSGTGIGLAVCRTIVERHGGSIWVESEPGKGSVFYFTLPAQP